MKIVNLKEGNRAIVKGAIVQIFETKIFNNGNLVLSGVIDDGTGYIRFLATNLAVSEIVGIEFKEIVKKYSNLNYEEFLENIDILGIEYILAGEVKRNKIGELEFIINQSEKSEKEF
ncbi:MAG: hypothetical protein ACE5KE_00540 [Methanosarcinales archaeon]